MAKKVPGLSRALGAVSLASVAYGEIASSLYFALGIVALYALGFTPWVLLAVGGVFLLVALSYAEGTAAIPEPGGAATLVRRAFNDPLGFLTGWALFLDYLIVIALAALFVPHYFGNAVGWDAIQDEPWDVVAGILVIAGVAGIRLVRRPSLYRTAIILAAIALVAQVLLITLGLAYLVSAGEFGIGAVVLVSFGMGVVAIAAFPSGGEAWIRAPLMGIADALDGAGLPDTIADAVRIFTGISGVLVLVMAVTTTISGAGRLAYSLAPRNMLPHAFGVLNRRTLI